MLAGGETLRLRSVRKTPPDRGGLVMCNWVTLYQSGALLHVIRSHKKSTPNQLWTTTFSGYVMWIYLPDMTQGR